MKKLIALILALLLCLTSLPVLAEEAAAPALNLPITLEGYKQAYEAVINGVLPGNAISWTSAPLGDEAGAESHMAMINDAFISVMLLPVDGQVAELAVLLQADLSENTLMTFLSMAGYAGAALLIDEDTTAVEACDAFMNELINVFVSIQNGVAPESIYTLPGMLNITPMGDGTYQYYFVLSLIQPAAE